MKIKKISVKKLFGTRNFELTLNNGHGFFFGENGAGKTTFLNILYSLLSGQSDLIPKDLEFESFTIELDNGHSITKTQVFEWPVNNESIDQNLIANYNNFEQQIRNYKNYLESIKVNYPELNEIRIDDIIEAITNKNVGILINNSILNQNILTINNSITRDLGNRNPQSWYNNALAYYNNIVTLIEQSNLQKTRELLDTVNNDILYLNVYRNRPKILSKHLNQQHDQNIYEEGKIVLTSTKLDELKQKVQTSALNMKNLINTYYIDMSNSLLDKLLSSNNEDIDIILQDEDKQIVDRVFQYIHGIDVVKKEKLKKILFREESLNSINNILIEAFKPFIDKYKEEALPIEDNINKFLTTVNKYLVHKKIVFDKSDFKFQLLIGERQQPLDEKLLSSGEKHIFSVFSNLVFNKKSNIHLLIDEPELSLSINWQKMFIEDITEFTKVKNLIFVTHSPYVIPETMINDLQRFPSGNEDD